MRTQAAHLLLAVALAGALACAQAADAAMEETSSNYPSMVSGTAKTQIEQIHQTLGTRSANAENTVPTFNPNPPPAAPPVKVSAEVAAPWHNIARPESATCAVRQPLTDPSQCPARVTWQRTDYSCTGTLSGSNASGCSCVSMQRCRCKKRVDVREHIGAHTCYHPPQQLELERLQQGVWLALAPGGMIGVLLVRRLR